MRHIPNILSVFRILLIPFFVWQMLSDNTLIAALVLALSGITDVADGFLARRFGWITNVGKVLDPAADKLTQVTVCIMLVVRWPELWIFFALILFREFTMLVLGLWLVQSNVRIESSRWFGKVVTSLFYALTFLLILLPDIPMPIKAIMMAFVTVLAFAAGVLYIPTFVRYKSQALNSTSQIAAPEEQH